MPDTDYPVEFDVRYTASDSGAPRELAIALFDVLGFTTLIRTNALGVVAESYRRLLARLDSSTQQPLFSFVSKGPPVKWITRSAVYSDTILLWSDLGDWELSMFLRSCSYLLGEAATSGWPLRGAVTVGECVINPGENIFIGEPIIRALELEKSQQWVGAGIDTLLASHRTWGQSVREHVDVRGYDVPVRPGSAPLRWAITWMAQERDAIQDLRQLRDNAPVAEQPRYEETIAFLLSGTKTT